jgi:hypothetical protein
MFSKLGDAKMYKQNWFDTLNQSVEQAAKNGFVGIRA